MNKFSFFNLTLERLAEKGYRGFYDFTYTTQGDEDCHILFRCENKSGIEMEFAYCVYNYAVKYRAVGQKYWEAMGVIV